MNKDQTEKLLKKLGSRTEPNSRQQAKSKQAVRDHWQRTIIQNRRSRIQKIALAASLVLVVALTSLWLAVPGDQTSTNLIQQFTAQGPVSYRTAQGETQLLTANKTIAAGEKIFSGTNGAVVWKLIDGSELRQGPSTEITWIDGHHIRLYQGQLYHDTDVAKTAEDFTISSRFGTIQHTGTRYAVNQDNDKIQIAVRNGSVKVKTNNDQQQTVQAEQLYAVSHDGTSQIKHLEPYDAQMWDWAFKVQQPYPLNGVSLYQFIQWFAQENSLEIEWNNNQSSSRTVFLQGTIENMTPQTALKTVFTSTKFDYQLEKGRLKIIQP